MLEILPAYLRKQQFSIQVRIFTGILANEKNLLVFKAYILRNKQGVTIVNLKYNESRKKFLIIFCIY